MHGCYHINDNGYHKWGTSMEPSKAPENEDELRWSEMLESLRKDVECFFGILKNIFSILKYGSRFKKWEIIDNILKASKFFKGFNIYLDFRPNKI